MGLSRLSAEPVSSGSRLSGRPDRGLAIAWGWKRPGDRRVVAISLGLLGLVELGFDGHALMVTTPASRFLGPDPIGEALLRASPPGLEPPRIRTVDALYGDLLAGRLGFTMTNVNDSFQFRHAADLYETLYHVFTPESDDRGAPMDLAVAAYRQEIRQAVLDRMGVSLLVSDKLVPGSSWERVASGSGDGSAVTSVLAEPDGAASGLRRPSRRGRVR